jgi:hypothetical protein
MHTTFFAGTIRESLDISSVSQFLPNAIINECPSESIDNGKGCWFTVTNDR